MTGGWNRLSRSCTEVAPTTGGPSAELGSSWITTTVATATAAAATSRITHQRGPRRRVEGVGSGPARRCAEVASIGMGCSFLPLTAVELQGGRVAAVGGGGPAAGRLAAGPPPGGHLRRVATGRVGSGRVLAVLPSPGRTGPRAAAPDSRW